MPRPVPFEIHASNPPRAIDFYGNLFGWTFTKGPGPVDYWLTKTGEDAQGIDGGLVKRMGTDPAMHAPDPVNAYVCTVGNVARVDSTVDRDLSLGAVVALPRMAVPGVGWLAYIKDSEGNLVGIMQNDPAAK